MHNQDLVFDIIPKDLFDIRRDGTLVESIQHLIEQCHPGTTKMKLETLSGEESVASIPFAMSNRALHGLLHGGAYFTVGDTITAMMCLFFVEEPNERMVTVNASIRYLRPVNRETIKARALLKRREGKNLYFVCDFFLPDGKRAAQAKYHYVLAQIR
ncbi:MAG TPA: PaaI family thioesterase [Turneriella sp.]|nr:PaaI family thioesterase [Turneriella sp.]